MPEIKIWTYNVIGWEDVPYAQANTSEASYNHPDARRVVEEHTRERFAQEYPNRKIRFAWWAWSPVYNEEDATDD